MDVLTKCKKNYFKNVIWRQPLVKTIIVLVCIIADSLTVYNIIEQYITQSFYLSIMITIVCTGVMNLSPVLIGYYLSEGSEYNRMKKAQILSLCMIFLLLFITTFILRWTSRQDIFSNNDPQLNLMVVDTSLSERSISASENALAILLGLEPLATSLLCFALSYENDPKRVRLQMLTVNHLLLEKERERLKLLIYDLKNDLDSRDLSKEDEELFTIACNEARNYYDVIKLETRKLLAEKLKSPDAVSWLLEYDSNMED